MTPQQTKAKELVNKFDYAIATGNELLQKRGARQCAIIAINELIEQNGELYLLSIPDIKAFYKRKNAELFELKTEIEKL